MPHGGPVLPAFFEWQAPAEWRAVDFVSDLHLSPALPRTQAAFARHLRTTSADAVVILGDLFEIWLGDDARALPYESAAVELLAEAASRRPLFFMVGNRDFLFGSSALVATGMAGLPDPTVMQAWGQRLLLTHGDALCLADTDYQRFRAEVRSEAWRQRTLALPLEARVDLARRLRQASRERHGLDGRTDVDVDAATAVAWLHALGAAEMVHGHTHRPGSNELAPGFKRHVLSDWDLDDAAHPRAQVLRLTRDGFERLPVQA